MFPDQQNQPSSPTPTSTPLPQHDFQQHTSGRYEVVPPLPSASNDGHSGHNAYDFILSPAPKRHAPIAGKTLLLRVGLIGGAVVILLIVVAVTLSALKPKGATPGLTAIAQRQQELIRISNAAILQSTGQDTLNFVSNLNLSVTSSQQQTLAYLANHGTKLGIQTLALDKSTQTDSLLTNATSTNTYDSAVVQNLVSQLRTYESLIQSTARQTSNAQTRQLLQTSLTGADRLLTQASTIPGGQ